MQLPTEHNHVVDFDKIKRDAFILLNLGYGSMRLRHDEEADVNQRKDSKIFREFGNLYSREVSSILTSIAISGRMLDDIIKRTGKGVSASKWEFEETLGNDAGGKFLSLRECFNKVIHAETISHELMQLPEVYLNGKRQNGKEWNVRVCILPFCVSVFEWVSENQA